MLAAAHRPMRVLSILFFIIHMDEFPLLQTRKRRRIETPGTRREWEKGFFVFKGIVARAYMFFSIGLNQNNKFGYKINMFRRRERKL